ncbi:MAG: ATP synthase F1 subunit epsilon [Pikeienuella sp.]
MSDMMSFELVSPERRLASGEADMVTIPGADGDIGAQHGHTPLMTTLRPGLLVVTKGSESTAYFVTGGFAEITPEGVSILAEETLPKAELNRDFLDERIEAARAELDALDADDHIGQRSASQRLNDLITAVDQIL